MVPANVRLLLNVVESIVLFFLAPPLLRNRFAEFFPEPSLVGEPQPGPQRGYITFLIRGVYRQLEPLLKIV